MPMSSYEVVRRAIEFDRPDRLPVRFDWLGITDVRSVPWNQIGTGNNAERRSLDEWGCGWERTDIQNMGQVKGHPLQDWSALDSFRFPDPDTPAFYEGMEQFFEVEEEIYRCTGIFMLLFERMHALRGFENTLLDLYADPERIGWLADRIVDFDLGIIRNIHERFGNRIQGFGFTDDWGTERDLFISPELWAAFFKPRYKRIFDACHAQGWHVWMHSCGKVNDIIEPLIDIGLNVINLQQPRALGIEEIGARYRGRITFWGELDRQHILPFGTPADVHAAVIRVKAALGDTCGGVIGQAEINQGYSLENIRAFFEAWWGQPEED